MDMEAVMAKKASTKKTSVKETKKKTVSKTASSKKNAVINKTAKALKAKPKAVKKVV